MEPLVLIGTAIAAVTYVFLIINTWRGAVDQNPATFLLWGVLNTIAAISMFLQGSATFLLTAFYAIAAFVMVLAANRGGTWRRWTYREWLAAAMVAVSIVIWYFTTDELATVASTVGVLVAAIPLLLDLWKDPRKSPFVSYIALTIANFFALAAADSWTVRDAFYPGMCNLLMAVTLWFSVRQFFRPYRLQSAH